MHGLIVFDLIRKICKNVAKRFWRVAVKYKCVK